MCAARNSLHVSLALDHIHCLDEGDGPGNAEPYLWTLFFKIDGATCRLLANLKLNGSITVVRTIGEHGNLGNTDVDAGDDIPIPPPLGRWDTTLVPIPLENPITLREPPGETIVDIPGTVGVVCILMEEDNLPDSAARDGYNAFCSTFETKMNEVINSLGLTQQDLTDENENQIQNGVRQAIEEAMANNLNILESIWNWVAGPDQNLGSATFRFTHDQLAAQRNIAFTDRWKQGLSVFDPLDDNWKDMVVSGPGRFIESGGEWQIFGKVSAKPVEQYIGSFGPVINFTQEEIVMQAFRHRAELASRQGYVGAFPNFYIISSGIDEYGGTVFIKPGFAEWRDIPLSELSNPALSDFGARFRATQLYATQHGFIGGFPNFFHAERLVLSPIHGGLEAVTILDNSRHPSEQQPTLQGLFTETDVTGRVGVGAPRSGMVMATVCGTVLIRQDRAEFRDVPLAYLGNPNLSDIEARFRSTQDYAIQQGFVGGFPTFFHANQGNAIVCGTILLRHQAAERRDVLIWAGPR